MEEDHKNNLKKFLTELATDPALFEKYTAAMTTDDKGQAIEEILKPKGLAQETITVFKGKDVNLVKDHLTTNFGPEMILIVIFVYPTLKE